jgi:hypothetical protein
MYVYNTTEHSATGYTPFELIFGHQSTLPSALKDYPGPQYNHYDYVTELKSRLQAARQMARESLVSSKTRSKDYYDKKAESQNLSVGDKALLCDETVRRGRSKKLSSQWIGPYEVVAVDKVNATIKRGQLQKVHINRIKPFY